MHNIRITGIGTYNIVPGVPSLVNITFLTAGLREAEEHDAAAVFKIHYYNISSRAALLQAPDNLLCDVLTRVLPRRVRLRRLRLRILIEIGFHSKIVIRSPKYTTRYLATPTCGIISLCTCLYISIPTIIDMILLI